MTKFLQIAKKWGPVVLISFLVFTFPLSVFAQVVPGGGVVVEPIGGRLDKSGLFRALEKVVNFLIIFGGIIAVGFIVIAGFKYIFSGGNAEKAGEARTMLWNGLIGLIIVIAAYLIVNTVYSLVRGFIT